MPVSDSADVSVSYNSITGNEREEQMSLSEKMDAIYKKQQSVQRNPEVFREVAETMFEYVSEDLLKKAERGAYGMSGLFGGGRPLVRSDIHVRSIPAFPRDHIEIESRSSVKVNSFQREGKKLFREIKKLANKEGIKCFTGSHNIGFEYYLKR